MGTSVERNPENELVLLQYDIVWRKVEYLDSYIPKSMAVYSVFIAAVITNTERIIAHSKTVPFVVVFILCVSVFHYLILMRIASLVEIQIDTAKSIEAHFEAQNLASFSPVPSKWGKGISTSRVSRLGITGLASLAVFALLYPTYF